MSHFVAELSMDYFHDIFPTLPFLTTQTHTKGDEEQDKRQTTTKQRQFQHTLGTH